MLKFMEHKKISIIIPIYNEARTLRDLISAVENINLPVEKEVVLIDDYSNDGSRELLKSYTDKHKVIFRSENNGKGMAVREGFKEASGDIVLIQDADLEYSPHDYPRLIEPIISGKADVVYGSRFLGSEISKNNKFIYKRGLLFSKFLNFMSNAFNGLKISDMYTCYKVFTAESVRQINPRLRSRRFGIDPELTAWTAKLKLRVAEVPISYSGRTYEEGKKINWKDGLAAIFHIIRFNIFTHK